ncbi:hypothetical protein ACFLUV_05795 [Elusimicrobiota bacterium]
MFNSRDEISRVFGLFKEKGIPFIILRSHDFLMDTEISPPNELDIIIPSKYKAEVIDLFLKERYYPGFCKDSWFFGRNLPARRAFHVYFEKVYTRYMGSQTYPELMEYSTESQGCMCLGGAGLLAHLIIVCLIDKKDFPEKHRKRINELLENVKNEEVLNILGKYFTGKAADNIIESLRAGKYREVEKKHRQYMFLFILKKPGNLYGYLKYVKMRLNEKSILPKFGVVAAFIGLDGVGKTTISNSLMEVLKYFGAKYKYVYMGRVRKHVLPMDKIAKKVGISQMKNKNIEKEGYNSAYLIIRDSIYALDMMLRYIINILPYKLFNYVIICDRYAYDVYQDKNQTFISRFVLKFCYPRPDLLFFLDLPDEEIIKRKKEYGSNKRAYLRKSWEEVAVNFKAIKIITDDIDKNIFQIYELISLKLFKCLRSVRNIREKI